MQVAALVQVRWVLVTVRVWVHFCEVSGVREFRLVTVWAHFCWIAAGC